MNGFEFNKIMGAIFLAMLVAMMAGFIARELVEPKELEKNVYVVEGVQADNPAAEAPAADKGPGPIGPLLATASPEAGQKYARVCGACHDFTKGGPNKVGPNLYNIVMNVHAHMDGYSYSDGMSGLHDKKWTYDDLNVFLYNPRNAVHGTKMSFAGIKSDQDRANVIAYLHTLSDDPVPLPGK